MTPEVESIPSPAPSTVNLIREIAGYVVARNPISQGSKHLLAHAVNDYQDQIRMMLAVIGSHKMQRIANILAAVDLCQEKLTDPEYLKALSMYPDEFRRHYALLKEVEKSDLEFLRSQVSSDAEKEGFSRDPRQQYNFFFGQATSKALLPVDLTIEERRKTRAVIDELFALVSGPEKPKPPKSPDRVIDTTYEVKEGNGTKPTNGTDNS